MNNSSDRNSLEPLIEFRNAALGYGEKTVLKNVTMCIFRGDYLGLVGPNGAGKTTMLRAILGSIKPISGMVVIHDRTARLGYVPQRESLEAILPFTAGEVVMMGRYRMLGLFGKPRATDRGIVVESLQHVGIADLQDVPFNKLSGGQKQRVLIARALASKPDVLILDEPTNGMDLSSKAATLELIRMLHDEDKLTVILVTHMLDDVANHVKQIALVERNFFQVGSVDEVLTEKNLSAIYEMPVRVKEFDGGKVVLPGARNVPR